MTCALCGKPALGYGRGPGGEPLCHSVRRDCYHRWTVWGERPDGLRDLRRRIEAGDPEAIEAVQRAFAAVAEAMSDWLESVRPALRRLAEIVDQPEVRAYLATKDLRRDLGAEHLRQNHAVYGGGPS